MEFGVPFFPINVKFIIFKLTLPFKKKDLWSSCLNQNLSLLSEKNSRSTHIVINKKEGSEFGVSLELVEEQLNLKKCCECEAVYFCKFLLYPCGNKRFCHLINDFILLFSPFYRIIYEMVPKLAFS